MVVSAIKELGIGIDDEAVAKIRHRLSERSRAVLLEESAHVTKWIYEVIKRICQ